MTIKGNENLMLYMNPISIGLMVWSFYLGAGLLILNIVGYNSGWFGYCERKYLKKIEAEELSNIDSSCTNNFCTKDGSRKCNNYPVCNDGYFATRD